MAGIYKVYAILVFDGDELDTIEVYDNKPAAECDLRTLKQCRRDGCFAELRELVLHDKPLTINERGK